LKPAGSRALPFSCHTAISRLTPLAIMRLGHENTTLESELYLQSMGARRGWNVSSTAVWS
jgi:hypothetical protein